MIYKTCPNCGLSSKYKKIQPLDLDLKNKWKLSEALYQLFNIREGYICSKCGANLRAQDLAQGILKSKYGYGQKTLKDWVEIANRNNLRVCELNSCHNLHGTLRKLTNFTYAEYGTNSEENIEKLSYSNNQFDLLLHSEVLEHVNDPVKAMQECRRVIRKNGLVIFTCPVIWNRKTIRRASRVNGSISHILSTSYHGYAKDDYLVFFEWGRDISSIIGIKILIKNSKAQSYVFFSEKSFNTLSRMNILRLRLNEYRALKINEGH